MWKPQVGKKSVTPPGQSVPEVRGPATCKVSLQTLHILAANRSQRQEPPPVVLSGVIQATQDSPAGLASPYSSVKCVVTGVASCREVEMGKRDKEW